MGRLERVGDKDGQTGEGGGQGGKLKRAEQGG